jgi:biopolymer transport protein ExbD
MSMGEIAFRPVRRRRRGMVNLTSLIDVLFLLLIFFMLTSTFRRSGEMELQLPESSTSAPRLEGAGERSMEITLRADGRILIDGVDTEPSEAARELRDKASDDPNARVLLNAEAEARHADVVRLLDLVREAGFRGVNLGTEIPRFEGGDAKEQP